MIMVRVFFFFNNNSKSFFVKKNNSKSFGTLFYGVNKSQSFIVVTFEILKRKVFYDLKVKID